VLFADPALKALALAVAQSPAQFAGLLDWQRMKFAEPLPADQKAHFEEFIAVVIADNFTMPPGSGPAFMQMGAQFYEELKRNSARLPLVKALDLPVKVIWGEFDPYLNVAMEGNGPLISKMARSIRCGGHWLQSDMPAQVAGLMLS